MKSLESLVSVARRVLRKENQNNVHESDANENVKGTLKGKLLPFARHSYSTVLLYHGNSQLYGVGHSD